MSRGEVPPEMLTAPLSADVLADRIGAALRRGWGDMRHATKRLSRRVQADPRAVENWMAGRNAPQSAQLIRLMAECEAVRAEVNALVEQEIAARALDPHG